MSTGEGWTGWTGPTNYSAAPNWCVNLHIGTGDFNGDGRSDFTCHNYAGSKETWVRLSKDRVAGLTPQALWSSGWCVTERPSDFNGDGKTDLLCHSGTTSKVAVSGALRGRTDVLEDVTSSLGGTTSVTYTPSSDWENTNGPPIRETVTSVTVEDGRGWQSTTSYTYAGGLFDAAKGRDLGFGYSKVTFPKLATETAAPYAESWFSQTIASAGAVTKSERRDGAGKIFHATENAIDISGDGTTEPYRAQVTERWSYVYDGTVTGCASWPCTNGERRYQEYEYDNWGNTIETRSWGNYDVSGDETTSIAEFYPNDSTYVTGKTARQASYVGIGTAGTKLSEGRFFYDDATQHTSSPVEGLLTKTSAWRNTDNQFVPMCSLASCIEYDAYGNVTKTTDIKGGETTLVYDTTYHLFPTSSTNALGHVSSVSFDPVCEVALTATNPNSQTTTSTYDELCRHERTDGPLGSFAESFYQNIGTPGTQYVEMQGPSPSGSGVSWARTYMDGLGRSYKKESRGPTVGQEILSGEATFNQRGGVLTSTATRYVGETAQVTSYEYDALDRLKKTTLPDSNTILQNYGLRETYVTNPEGDITGEARNETGLARYVIEYLGSTPIVTSITTNLANRSQTTLDHVGNTWVTQTNSLGQATWVSDPDSGTETRGVQQRRRADCGH
jgi:YD repeat-containing protein